MLTNTTQSTEPSYFNLVMAKSCFRRAAITPHPKAGSTLRDLGRDYLAKASAMPAVSRTIG
jgi:hypothetical protein